MYYNETQYSVVDCQRVAPGLRGIADFFFFSSLKTYLTVSFTTLGTPQSLSIPPPRPFPNRHTATTSSSSFHHIIIIIRTQYTQTQHLREQPPSRSRLRYCIKVVCIIHPRCIYPCFHVRLTL